MSKKSLSPQSGARSAPWRLPVRFLPIHGSWKSSSADSPDVKFLRSWLVYDSEADTGFKPSRVNWRLLLGLAIMVVVSTSFWMGVGLLIARIWR